MPAATSTDEPSPVVAGRAGRIAVFSIVFLAFIDNFALLPVVGPYARSLGAGPLGIGVAVAAYSLTNLVFDVVGGSLVDRFGRRRTLAWSLAISPVALAAYTLATSTEMLIALRVVHGAAGGMVTAAVFTVVGDIAPVGQRGRYVGRAGALIGIAAVVGPAFGGAASTGDRYATVFLTVAALLVVGLLLTVRLVPETLARVATPSAGDPGRWRALVARPMLQASYLGTFAYTFAVGTVAAFFAVDLEDAGYGRATSGGLLAVFGLVAVLVMLSRRSRAVDERGPVPPTVTGLCFLIGSTALLSLPVSIVGATAAMVLYGLGYGFVFPAVGGAVTLATQPEERGRAYGLFNVAFDLGIGVGPIVGGAVLGATGSAAYAPATVVCALAAGVLIARRGRAGRRAGR